MTGVGLRESRDGGASWAPPRGILPVAVNGVAFHPYRQGSIVVAGVDYSVFTSADGGATWQRGGDLFPACRFCPLPSPLGFAFDPADPRHVLVAAAGQLFASRRRR